MNPKIMPQVLYQGSYTFRSSNGLLSMLITGAFGIVCVWVSIQCFTKIHTSLSQFVGSIFAMSAIGLLGLSINVLIGIINGREEAVTIGTDGITHDQRFESWADISEFYGTAYFNGISLGYTANRGKLHVERHMPTTPLLSVGQFRELTEEMCRHVSTKYPHVRIETIPREPDTGS